VVLVAQLGLELEGGPMIAQVVNGAEIETVVEQKRPAYDPNNLAPEDEEARKYDDTSEGIDWDEIIATTQDDWEAGRYTEFKASDYPTDETLFEAILQHWDSGPEGEGL
jgi:hypothetical protein